MLIAQISDLHVCAPGRQVYGHVPTDALLSRCIETLRKREPRPDLVIATGDLVDAGSVEEYEHLRRLLDGLDMPLYLLVGNHDARGPLREVFHDHAYLPRGGEFLHYVVDDFPLKLVVLDTHVPGETGGLMCAERLAWLDERLAERAAERVVVAMHHPPFRVGLDSMDGINCAGGDAMAEVVRRYPNVERVIAGHVHRPIQLRWAGTLACVAPSTAHQIELAITPASFPGYRFEPPAYLLHKWLSGTGLVTHTAYAGDFEGPFPYRELAQEPAPAA